LMSETDPEKWFTKRQNFFGGGYRIIHDRRVAGAIGKEISIWIPRFHFRKACLGWENLTIHSSSGKIPENISFYAVINTSNLYGSIFITVKIRLLGRDLRRKL